MLMVKVRWALSEWNIGMYIGEYGDIVLIYEAGKNIYMTCYFVTEGLKQMTESVRGKDMIIIKMKYFYLIGIFPLKYNGVWR